MFIIRRTIYPSLFWMLMFFLIVERLCFFMDDVWRAFCLISVWMYFKHRVVLLAEVVLTIAKSSAISLHSIIRASHEYQLLQMT